jgi:putative membrane protein
MTIYLGMNNTGHTVARGTTAGTIATAAMSALMWGAQRAGLLGKAPPQKISERVLWRTLRAWPRRRHRQALSLANHLAFGAAAGALFPLGTRRLSSRAARVAAGSVYGLMVWAVMYQRVLPALRLMPEPRRDRLGRPATMIAAHLVYGAVLGAIV